MDAFMKLPSYFLFKKLYVSTIINNENSNPIIWIYVEDVLNILYTISISKIELRIDPNLYKSILYIEEAYPTEHNIANMNITSKNTSSKC